MDLFDRILKAAQIGVDAQLPAQKEEDLSEALHLGQLQIRLRGLYLLMAELSTEPANLQLDLRAVSRIFASSVQAQFQDKLDERRKNGGGPAYKIVLKDDWQIYVVPLEGIRFEARGLMMNQ